jgi:hypothetical protein
MHGGSEIRPRENTFQNAPATSHDAAKCHTLHYFLCQQWIIPNDGAPAMYSLNFSGSLGMWEVLQATQFMQLVMYPHETYFVRSIMVSMNKV